MVGPFTAEFGECGGCDCMTGAWTVYDSRRKIAVVVDQSDYDQRRCDYAYRSPDAQRVAEIIVEALNREWS